jgi:glucose-6-phosphate isomerase
MAQHVTSLDEILITVITKSGGTSETLANAEFVIDAFAQHNEDIHNRLVFITDEGSRLWQAATEKSCAVLPIPAKVGGRYSVFSAVGLFPLACAGYDIQALLRGAAEMREQCLLEENNPAIDSAALLFEANNQGFFINDNFIFHGELESVGKWYRQLMGESIGKEEDREGNAVTAGITPTVSIGSTDLHSVGQLYLGGPKNKLTTFISAVQQAPIRVPENRLFPDLVPNITGISFKEIMNAIREGTQKAYKKQGAPFMNIELSAINESELGAFMQFKMIEMMYLGRLMQVNPFDQPHVELYKIETKRILEQQ